MIADSAIAIQGQRGKNLNQEARDTGTKSSVTPLLCVGSVVSVSSVPVISATSVPVASVFSFSALTTRASFL
jgi:hypothetical protein